MPSFDPHAAFETHRAYLRGLAYRMLGSRAEAEDAVQDAWLRWREVDHTGVEAPRAYLGQTITRLCLDRLKSAQAQRTLYVGQWLPEPLVEEHALYAPEPERASELASDLSFAFMRTLEQLSPPERAAFLLHDVFDLSFKDIARTLERSEAACRQLASRAREHVRADKPRFSVPREMGERLATAFVKAIEAGDVEGLAGVLAEDAVFISDGGGKVAAVPQPLIGGNRIAKALVKFQKLYDPLDHFMQPGQINGEAGVLVTRADGSLIQTVSFEIDDAGRIAGVYIQRNPEKLPRPAMSRT